MNPPAEAPRYSFLLRVRLPMPMMRVGDAARSFPLGGCWNHIDGFNGGVMNRFRHRRPWRPPVNRDRTAVNGREAGTPILSPREGPTPSASGVEGSLASRPLTPLTGSELSTGRGATRESLIGKWRRRANPFPVFPFPLPPAL